MAIKAIIFDCFGVLYRDNVSMLYDAVPLENHIALRDIVHAADYGFMDRNEYYQSIAELADSTADDIRNIESRQHSRDEAMIELSQNLKPQYKVGLLSNIDVDTMDRLFPEPMRSRLFDTFVISGEVGVIKPALQIFEIVAERLGLRPQECVMIDDLMRNIEGAKMAGMQGVLFTSRPQLKRDLEAIGINA